MRKTVLGWPLPCDRGFYVPLGTSFSLEKRAQDYYETNDNDQYSANSASKHQGRCEWESSCGKHKSITPWQEPTGLWSHLPKGAIPLAWAPSMRSGVSKDQEGSWRSCFHLIKMQCFNSIASSFLPLSRDYRQCSSGEMWRWEVSTMWINEDLAAWTRESGRTGTGWLSPSSYIKLE